MIFDTNSSTSIISNALIKMLVNYVHVILWIVLLVLDNIAGRIRYGYVNVYFFPEKFESGRFLGIGISLVEAMRIF